MFEEGGDQDSAATWPQSHWTSTSLIIIIILKRPYAGIRPAGQDGIVVDEIQLGQVYYGVLTQLVEVRLQSDREKKCSFS